MSLHLQAMLFLKQDVIERIFAAVFLQVSF